MNTWFQMVVSLLFAEVSDHVGKEVFQNFFTGKYNKATTKTRAGMFLNIRSSTTIAEQLRHHRYFELLRQYYEVMADRIIAFGGGAYQYVGDEMVSTWDFKDGNPDNCRIACF